MIYLFSKRIFILSLLSSLFFAACSGDKIDEDKFVKIYSDLVIAQDTSRANQKNITEIKNRVLKRYSVNEKEYNATVEYYNEDPKKWSDFFDKVLAHLEILKSKSTAKQNKSNGEKSSDSGRIPKMNKIIRMDSLK